MQVRTYVGDDGKLHSVDGTGADTVLNFSSLRMVESSENDITVTPAEKVISLKNGIKPKIIIAFAKNDIPRLYWEDNFLGFPGTTALTATTSGSHLRPYNVTAESFRIKSYNSNSYTMKYWCFA